MDIKKNMRDWVIFLLILIFFAIPFLALTVTDQVTSWPKCPSSVVLKILPK